MANGLVAGREPFEPSSIHQEDVEPPVVVVVVKGDAATSRLEQVFVLVFAAENSFRDEAGFARDVDERDVETRCRCG